MKYNNDDNVYVEAYIDYVQYRSNENKDFNIIQRLLEMKEHSMLG